MIALQDGAVALDRRGPIARVTLDRPAKLNAMTTSMYARFAELFAYLGRDTDVRAVILHGAGDRAFCVGSDIGDFQRAIGNPDRLRLDALIGREAVDALAACPVPVIAAIEGACFGGGLMLAAACDLRVASRSARFGLPVKNLGMFVELEDLRALLDTFGAGMVRKLLYLGAELDTPAAAAAGFLAEIADDGDVLDRAVEMAETIVAGAPLAARWHKQALARLLDPRPPDQAERAAAYAVFTTQDFSEGCQAFLAKRFPRFTGR